MSESVIADFVAAFDAGSTGGEPTRGRVLLSQRRLVFAATDEDRVTIPLSAITDVAVGQVPDGMADFFDATVTVAFERGGDRHAAAIEADDEDIEKFSTVLFKAILNGSDVFVKHPARRGGRVTDQEFAPARLALQSRRVTFESPQGETAIRLSTVTEFDRSTRSVGGSQRPVLAVRHMEDGQSTLSLVATGSERRAAILGRYLRREYSNLMDELADIEISTDEKELLVALYSGAGSQGMSLANVVGTDAANVTMMLNRLAEDELVVDSERGTTLTPKGQVVVSNLLEDVDT